MRLEAFPEWALSPWPGLRSGSPTAEGPQENVPERISANALDTTFDAPFSREQPAVLLRHSPILPRQYDPFPSTLTTPISHQREGDFITAFENKNHVVPVPGR